ncbi:hypothetical protein E4U51_005532 [Claviceps purpurea]|nr:hypothetical protein E4U51_005532 [Claviceps purpurea]
MSDTEKTKTNIILYLAAGSPQGNSIIGELKAQYLEYEVHYIDLTKGIEPWFLEISPIGIIPALTETVHGEDVAVFGTAAILRYLHNEFRRRAPLPHNNIYTWSLRTLLSKRTPLSLRNHWEAVNWTCWILHRPGLIQALMFDLRRHLPDRMLSADFLKREMLALYGYLNEFYADNEEPFIAGDQPSIADVAVLEWISCHALIGLSLDNDPAIRGKHENLEQLVPFAEDCTRVPSPAMLVLC